jgi:hypothetical protein
MKAHQTEIQQLAQAATEKLLRHVRDEGKLAIVKAPPGSGKTHLLLQAAGEAFRLRQRVAIATQTRSQADDICRRLVQQFGLKGYRFVAKNGVAPALPPGIVIESDQDSLPTGPCIVVATTAKWGTIDVQHPFDVLFVEEAWQMKWADFMLLGQVAARFVLIGDPGQIPPVVPIDASRWETAPRGPHKPAPEVALEGNAGIALAVDLPATRRLPYSTAALIKPFYDFEFGTWAGPDDRRLIRGRRPSGRFSASLNRLEAGSVVGLTLPTPDGGPPLECDDEIAGAAIDVVQALLESQPTYHMGAERRPLQPAHIGLCATHHVMNAAMALRRSLKLAAVTIDTPERWQGLERPVMVVVHPLSGVVQPSAFDLETGRLCVMASRHQIALVIVSRNHLTETLHEHLPVAGQAIGRPDVSGRGHHQNLTLWTSLLEQDRVVELKSA